MPDDSIYSNLLVRAIADAHKCMSTPSCEMDLDLKYAKRRAANEGIQFLTTTLPSLGKAIDASFNSGHLLTPTSFKHNRACGANYPAFMREFFRRVYATDGELLENPDSEAVGHLRQVCFMFYKLEAEYSDESVQKAINDFCAVDDDLANVDLSSNDLRPVFIEARKMLKRVFDGFDPYDILPRPGPGASASGSPKWKRYEMLTHWGQIHQVYPFYEYFYVNRKHLVDRASDYRSAPRKGQPLSRMRMVPKDSRGPRIICMEEQEVMFLQQGLADKMRAVIQRHPLTKGRVNFTSQEINRQLARRSSLMSNDVEYTSKATLDMKEASDRVSRQLVTSLFDGTTLLRPFLALSTRGIILPSGDELQTLKFAPMGSSLCFPVMSLVHFALGVSIIKCLHNPSRKALANCMHVYGDDLIVDTKYVATLFEWFPKFGLKFNEGKSFYQGPFRESCGFDAFRGRNVTPQRIKRRFFDSTTPQHLVAALDTESLLYDRGYELTAEYVRCVMSHRVGESLPFVIRGSCILGWRRSHPFDCEISSLKCRRNRSTQSVDVRARVIETEPSISMAGGWEQLMRSLTGVHQGSDRLTGPNDRYSIAWRWVSRTEAYSSRGVLPRRMSGF